MTIHRYGLSCKGDRTVEHRPADDDRVGAGRDGRLDVGGRPNAPGGQEQAGHARRARSAAGRGRARGRCRRGRSRSRGSRRRPPPSGGSRTRSPRRRCPAPSRACARGRRGSRARPRPGPSRPRAGPRARGRTPPACPPSPGRRPGRARPGSRSPLRRPPPSCTRRPGTARSRRSSRACSARARARAGGVEVDHVQPRSAGGGVAAGELDRVDREGGGTVVAALVQPHDPPAEQVDRRDRPACAQVDRRILAF